uniref:MULE transposase domain-containing protein n=1 Tax=Panagrolaimus superbus TaxID=310955 RepID=A0A914YK77_9BILA
MIFQSKLLLLLILLFPTLKFTSLHDSGVEDGNRRFFIFSSDPLIHFLSNSSHWFVDGTFKITPGISFQLVAVHARYNDTHQTIPCAYLLLPNKTEAVYTAALEALREMVDNAAPETVMVDFEKALHNAFADVFPEAHVSACFFHFCQSLRRHLSELGLTVLIDNDVEMASMFAMFRSLPFVPLEHVVTSFNALKNQILESYGEVNNVAAFVTYVENTYIGELLRNNRRRPPLFSHELWNVFDRTVAGSPRTNNSVEGCHNRLRSFMNFAVESDIIQLDAGVAPRPLSTVWRLLERRRVELTANFDHRDPLSYLRNMARTLAAL